MVYKAAAGPRHRWGTPAFSELALEPPPSIPALPLAIQVTLDKSLHLSVPNLSLLYQVGRENSTCVTRLLKIK